MSSADSNRVSAAGSALGYLAQVEYALLDALRRMDMEVELRLSIETVDDIALDIGGQPRGLWQTKNQVDRRGSLRSREVLREAGIDEESSLAGSGLPVGLYGIAASRVPVSAALS